MKALRFLAIGAACLAAFHVVRVVAERLDR